MYTDAKTPTAADLDAIYGARFYTGSDLGSRQPILTIAKVCLEELRNEDGTEKKFVLHFVESTKAARVEQDQHPGTCQGAGERSWRSGSAPPSSSAPIRNSPSRASRACVWRCSTPRRNRGRTAPAPTSRSSSVPWGSPIAVEASPLFILHETDDDADRSPHQAAEARLSAHPGGWQGAAVAPLDQAWCDVGGRYPGVVPALCEHQHRHPVCDTPCLDIDIEDPDAAEAIEDVVRERFEEHGAICVRFGRWPRRAIFFKAATPFKHAERKFIAPNGDTKQKVEMLADGRQVIVHGIHEGTGNPYSWFGPALYETPRDNLPEIDAAGADALLDEVARVLVEAHGYQLAPSRKPARQRPRDRDGEQLIGKCCSATFSPDIRCMRACAISPARWSVPAWTPAP